jgi:hypothetical protein
VSVFIKEIEQVTKDMNQRVSSFIQEVNDAVTRFFEAFSEEAQKKMAQLAKQIEDEGEEEEFSDDCVAFLDADLLKQSLDQSKEAIDGKVGSIDSEITIALNKDKDDVARRVEEDMHQRNRNIIKETVLMSDKLRDQVAATFKELRGDDD